MLVSGKTILEKANKGKYAVGAFNVNNMEMLQAIVRAAEKLRAPVIIQTSEGAMDYAGAEYLKAMVEVAAKGDIPICLHLDHGKDLAKIKEAIKLSYNSIMIDGSHWPFEENVKLTRKVVEMCRSKGISVEGELGMIGGAEDDVKGRKILYTEPDKAKEFVERTGVDSLAIAIGTSHGAYKFKGGVKLRFDILKEIKEKLKMPLVLHGASGVPSSIVTMAKHYGAKLKGVKGIPDEEIRKAVHYGINKINTDTDLRLAFDAAVRKAVKEKPDEFDPRIILGPARDLMQKVAEHRIKVFGSGGKK